MSYGILLLRLVFGLVLGAALLISFLTLILGRMQTRVRVQGHAA